MALEFTDLKGKVAFITGSSSGIGAATAVKFAALGVKVALTGRNQTRLAETVKKCLDAGLKKTDVFSMTGDITKPKEVDAIVKAFMKQFGQLDILVNCAGQIKAGLFMTTKMNEYDSLFDTNLKAAFIVLKSTVDHLTATKGCIVNISSFSGIRPCSSFFSYALAGAALDQFTKAMALELGPKGVRVNSVNPGVIKDTAFWTREGAPFDKMPEDKRIQLFEGLREQNPMKKLLSVDDVTPSIVYLCSQHSQSITGALLPVDAGKVLTSKGAFDLVAAKSM